MNESLNCSQVKREQNRAAFLGRILDYAFANNTFNPLNIINSTENVILFGVGRYFQEAFERQNVRERFHVKYLCDNDPEKWGKEFCGLPCISPEQVQRMSIREKESKKPAIIIMLGDGRDAYQQMSEIVGSSRCFHYNQLALLYNLQEPANLKNFLEQKSKFHAAFDLIKEEQSRNVFLNILAARIAPDLMEMKKEDLISQYPEYFDPSVTQLGDDEVFVDCGAYDGDTIRRFLEQTHNKFDTIHAFELSADNYGELVHNMVSLPNSIYQKINFYHAGISDHTREITYSEDSSGEGVSVHTLSNYAVHKAQLVKLDDCLANRKITFIKMDIEGEEMAALRGARELISKNQPKAAICVYHRTSDFWEVPLFFNEVMPGCEIRFRHYNSWGFWGSVCHIIPSKDIRHA